MKQTRSDIAYLLTAVLTAGLLVSTFHIHGGGQAQLNVPSETGLEYVQDHNFCPVCSVLYEGIELACIEMPGPDFAIEFLPRETDRIAIHNLYAVNNGRSPPALHI
ncbi:MAG: hypothetical protein WD035_07505 [Balneolaceae bacterium]